VDAALLWFLLGILFPALLGLAWLVIEKAKYFARYSPQRVPSNSVVAP
jgi:hypothetical protein